MILVVPLASDREADVHFVLVVGDKQFDRLAEHRIAEIADREAGDLDRSGAGEVGVGAGLVVHDADGEIVGGARRGGGCRQDEAKDEKSPNHGAWAPGKRLS